MSCYDPLIFFSETFGVKQLYLRQCIITAGMKVLYDLSLYESSYDWLGECYGIFFKNYI